MVGCLKKFDEPESVSDDQEIFRFLDQDALLAVLGSDKNPPTFSLGSLRIYQKIEAKIGDSSENRATHKIDGKEVDHPNCNPVFVSCWTTNTKISGSQFSDDKHKKIVVITSTVGKMKNMLSNLCSPSGFFRAAFKHGKIRYYDPDQHQDFEDPSKLVYFYKRNQFSADEEYRFALIFNCFYCSPGVVYYP